eukprot:4197874-Pyramimonas_sp.AAC.1
MARGVQRRIALEIRRQLEGRPMQRYKWDMFAAIWILQLANPGGLDRDHVWQLIRELGIREE